MSTDQGPVANDYEAGLEDDEVEVVWAGHFVITGQPVEHVSFAKKRAGSSRPSEIIILHSEIRRVVWNKRLIY